MVRTHWVYRWLWGVVGGLMLTTGALAERVLYVSPSGRDTWSGSLASPNAARTDGPFATLTRARDAARQFKNEAVTVKLRGGVYRLNETLTLTPDDSRTEQAPLAFVAYGNEQPVISGGRVISGWRPWKGQIQCASLPEVKAGKWNFRSLFANGERQIRARYPNVDPTDLYRKGFLYLRRGTEHISVGGMHNQGDTLDYELTVPATGDYDVWLRYAHGMKALGAPDMGGRTSLAVDRAAPVPLMNLPDSGGWDKYVWGKAATVRLTAGKHVLRWRNDKNGGLGIDQFVFCDDPAWTPSGAELPAVAAGRHRVSLEAESYVHASAPQMGLNVLDVVHLPQDEKNVLPFGPGEVKASWLQAPEPEVHIWPGHACRAYMQICRLEKVDPQAHMMTIGGPEAITPLYMGDRFFVENILEELDSPGEWYLDSKAGMVYYWPKEPLAKVEVTAPVMGRLIQFEGDETKGQALRHVRWSGLTFTQTDWSQDDGCVGWGTGNNGMVYLQGAVGCTIENCRLINSGKNAIYLKGGGKNVVSGNDISDSAEGGIVLSASSGNTISDNHIHDLGRVYKHVGGIVTGGSDNVVSHNLVHNTSRWAITLGATGTGTIVEYNEVYNTSLETFDTGGIMAYQDDRKFNCQATIRYNLVHDGVGFSSNMGTPLFDSRGIYIDGFSSGYTITHNISYRNSNNGGIFIQGGHEITITNNIVVGNGGPQYLHANFMKNSANLEFSHNILAARSPRVALMWIFGEGEKLTHFDYNLYWHPTGDICHPVAHSLAKWQELGFDPHGQLADPLFVNPQADDYSLKPDSPALKMGFEPIDVSRIGLLHKRCQCKSPFVKWGLEK
jgi:parallel beta-helix repeat protein